MNLSLLFAIVISVFQIGAHDVQLPQSDLYACYDEKGLQANGLRILAWQNRDD